MTPIDALVFGRQILDRAQRPAHTRTAANLATRFQRIPAVAVAVLAAVALTACGSGTVDGAAQAGSDSGAPGDSADDDTSGSIGVDSDDDDDSDDDGSAPGSETDPDGITLLLPVEGTTPDGWQRLPVVCEAPEKNENGDRPVDFVPGLTNFAFPAEWHTPGYAGQDENPQLADGYRMTMRTGDWDGDDYHEFTVRYDLDLEFMYFPETAERIARDHLIQGDDSSATNVQVFYDPVGTATLGDQQVDVFLAPKSQHELLPTTVYTTRVAVAEVPNPDSDSGFDSVLAEISVEFDPDQNGADVSLDTATRIMASFAMPQCSRDAVQP